MANITFPSNPTNGQKFTFNGKVFAYDSTTQRWSVTRAQLLGSLPDDVTIESPIVTFSSNNITVNALSNTFINYSVNKDATVTINNLTTNATAVLYTSNNTIKIDTTTDSIQLGTIRVSAYDGRNIGVGDFVFNVDNQPPFLSLPLSSYNLATDGSTTQVVVTATDPENQPLTYTSSVSGYANAIASVTNSANVYTVTPSTEFADQGTAIVTFQVSDGVNIKTANASFTLSGLAGAGDVTNATYTGFSLSLGNHNGSSGSTTENIEFCNSVWINPLDSSKLHLGYTDLNDNNNIMRVAEISLTTPNDISSATGTATVVWSGGIDTSNASRGMWEDNGNKWVVALSAGAFNIYNASTPYDFSTLGSPTTTVDFGGTIAGWVFNSDGTKLLAAQTADNLFEYSTTTPWDWSVKTQENFIADTFKGVTNSGTINTGGVIFHNNGEEFWAPSLYHNRIWDMTSAFQSGDSISPFDLTNYGIQVINSQDFLELDDVLSSSPQRSSWMDRKQQYLLIRDNNLVPTLYQYDVS
jgi:hypothetical protein